MAEKPRKVEPVSPIKTRALGQFQNRKPRQEAEIMRQASAKGWPLYPRVLAVLGRQATRPMAAKPSMPVEPARPSMPSIKLKKLVKARTLNKMNAPTARAI
jgi:hypothetical protein